jgi:hypothetical protein
MKYVLETPVKGIIGSEKVKTAIHWRNGVLITDEPEKLGGKDLGPDPYRCYSHHWFPVRWRHSECILNTKA